MQKHWIIMALALVLLVFFIVPSCTKKTISSEPATTISAEEEARRRAEEEARQKALSEEDLKEESIGEKMAEEGVASETAVFENEDIYFEFDSIRLTPEAQEILTKKANWLRENPQATVTIEGHCDNRGTNEYNLALGERRADAAWKFLNALGISGGRMVTVSYGEEKPAVQGHNESAWAKNRRDDFKVIK